MDRDHRRTFDRIRSVVAGQYTDADLDLLDRAYRFAYKAHRKQRRLSGEPYIVHSLAVAEILAGLRVGETAIAAGFLHDVIEDTDVTAEELRAEFGDGVVSLVDGVTKIPELKFESQERKQAENFHKMLLSMSQDLRVILIKFADRLHNMRTIEHMQRRTQERIARETLDVYAPLAHRLGIHHVKWELEDLSFKVLEPRAYRELAAKVDLKRDVREQLISQVIDRVRPELEQAGIKARVLGRAKHLYSIHKKIRDRGYTFDEILDLLAIRILVQTPAECYHALGIVHSLFCPIHDKFTDFIATPKSNMYQSLHTRVFGPDGRKIEIQIRSEEMHRTAEYGIAAHWLYKEGEASREDLDRQMEWLRSLLDEKSEAASSGEFMENLKIQLFQAEVFVFTPRGRLLTLPRGSSPIDFAFAVHTDIGLHTMAAKINGQIVPLRTKLKSGDVVEIITSQTQKPNPDWLKYVHTSRARSKIKRWLKEQHYEESMRLGREILTREFAKYRIKQTDHQLTETGLLFGYNSLESFLAGLGSGDVSVQSVLRKILPSDKSKDPEGWGSILSRVIRKVKGPGTAVRIHGMDNVVITFGRCCQPLPGDAITGFITTGRGVTVHRVDCKNIPDLMKHPERNLQVEWDVHREAKFNVRIRIVAKDRANLLGDITHMMAKEEVNMLYVEMKRDDAFAVGRFVLEVKSLPHLTKIFRRLNGIKDVIHVERFDEEISLET